jgi:hypothetical protein
LVVSALTDILHAHAIMLLLPLCFFWFSGFKFSLTRFVILEKS